MTTLPLPDRLYVTRKLRGLSQAALAELAGMTTKHYQRIETGHVVPRIDTVQALADALDCELTLKAKGSVDYQYISGQVAVIEREREALTARVPEQWRVEFFTLKGAA